MLVFLEILSFLERDNRWLRKPLNFSILINVHFLMNLSSKTLLILTENDSGADVTFKSFRS